MSVQPERVQPCPHGDPTCPCQDGDPCHYEDLPGSPAMTPPAACAATLLINERSVAACERDAGHDGLHTNGGATWTEHEAAVTWPAANPTA